MTATATKELIHGLKRKLSLFRYQPCALVLDGGTLLVAACDKSATGHELAARFAEMTGDEILAESEDNFAVHDNQVQKIRVERHGGGSDPEFSGGPDRIILKTAIGKQVFLFTGKGTGSPQAKELLAARFGARVR
jgi:hypothetical protein